MWNPKLRAVVVTVFACLVVIVVGVVALGGSDAVQDMNNQAVKKDRDNTARVIAFGSLVFTALKWVWDMWSGLERTASTLVNKNFNGLGKFFGIEVHNPCSGKVNIKRVQLVVKLANQPLPQKIDLRTGEDNNQTECVLEAKATADFFFAASAGLARENIEYIYISVESPTGRLEYIKDKKVREALLKG